jgi:hypothetical protein
MTDPNDSAWARPASTYPDEDRPSTLHYFEGSGGLTKREYFAALAANGMSVNLPEMGKSHAALIAQQAVQIADALIEELNK